MTVHTPEDGQREGAPSPIILTLRDVDNRDENEAPHEITARIDDVIAYLDGPLRADVISPSRGVVDATIEHLRAGRIADAIETGKRVGAWISVPDYDGEVAA